MHWFHPQYPDRQVRLAYCLNLHAAEDVAGTIDGMRRFTLPLRDRLANGNPFGVGVYLSHSAAQELAGPGGAEALDTFARFFADEGLDPFTFNAFPFSGFQTDGLKADVFKPTWMEQPRIDFTLAVLHVAQHLAQVTQSGAKPGHLSISTHTGMFGAWVNDDDDHKACARGMARVVEACVGLEAAGGPCVILSLEAEPRASAGDSQELAAFFALARPEVITHLMFATACSELEAIAQVHRHLGICLDTCHAAVEFEDPAAVLALAQKDGPLGKLQFSSALALKDPANAGAAREHLFGLDEPRYLHQVTGMPARSDAGKPVRLRAGDLPELEAALASAAAADWDACSEWRCHFHVPVDLEEIGDGLSTTRADADRTLTLALDAPRSWPTPELHVEIETYTWDVLPGSARGTGDLIDGLEREYRHVMALFETSGWRRP